MRITEDISRLIEQPYFVPTRGRSQSQTQSQSQAKVSSSGIRLKGLLETIRPPNKDIPISSYSFPKLKQIVEDLQEQLTDDEPKTILWLGTDQYMFLKNLLLQIEQKISNRKIPRTSAYGVSVDVLLILVSKLQYASTSSRQLSKLKQILLVMDKFIAVEKCLLGETESNLDARTQLLYDLDILFEAFLIELISASEEWSSSSINQKLKRRLIAVSDINLQPAIEKCIEDIPVSDIISTTRTNKSLYIKIRNELLLLCNEYGVQLPTPLTITMEYIRNAGKMMCDNTTSIENIISVFVMMGHSKKNALLISGLIKFYCDMQKDAKMSSITRFLLVLAQFKKAQDKQTKKETNTFIPETLEFAKKAEKVMNKNENTTKMHILRMNQSLGLPLSDEDKAYLKESSFAPLEQKHSVKYASSKEESKSQQISTKEKEAKPSIPIPRGPKNPATLFSKYTSIPGRVTDIADISIIQSVKDMIKDLDVDPSTAGLLLTGFFAMRRSFQIEGWNSLVRSFQYHLRKNLGEKMRGREPAPPSKLLSYGRTDFTKEKQIELKLNHATLLSNIMLMGTTVYSYVTYKILNTLDMDSSSKLMVQEISEETELESEDTEDTEDTDDDRKY